MEELEVSASNIYYLKKAPLLKAIAHLSIPMMIGISVSSIYNLINAFFIGLIHDTAMLSAITLGLPIFTVLMAVGNVLGVGGGTFITRLLGQNAPEKGKQAAGYSFYMSIVIGIVLAGLVLIFIDPIVKLLGADVNTLEYTRQYTLMMFGGGFAVILNFTLEQLVRSEGASKESMYGMFISVIFSILFDIIFILILDWHVVGAALSIVLANIAACAYYVWYLETRSQYLRGFLQQWRLGLKEQWEVYKIGISELLKASFLIVTTLLLNNYAMTYGDHVVAGFGIALRIIQLPEFLTMGLFLGVIPLIAYNYSARNKERLMDTIKHLCLWISVISIVFALVVYLFKIPVLQLFTNDPSVLASGLLILTAQLISSVFNGFTGLFTGIFQASGQGLPTAIMSITQGLLFIPVVIVLHYFFGLNGLIWSMTITEIITFVMGIVLLFPYLKKVRRLTEASS